MSKPMISVASSSPISVKADAQISESKGRKKGGAKSPRQVFFSELMKRLAGDAGNNVSNAFVNDRKKFKGMMISIIHEMSEVDDDGKEG